jgi:hypothetical protein
MPLRIDSSHRPQDQLPKPRTYSRPDSCIDLIIPRRAQVQEDQADNVKLHLISLVLHLRDDRFRLIWPVNRTDLPLKTLTRNPPVAQHGVQIGMPNGNYHPIWQTGLNFLLNLLYSRNLALQQTLSRICHLASLSARPTLLVHLRLCPKPQMQVDVLQRLHLSRTLPTPRQRRCTRQPRKRD